MSGPFLKGQFIKHKQAKDVCYYVKSVKSYGKTIKYQLEIWNMGFEKSWLIDTCKTEDIILSDFFILAGEKKPECLRYGNWLDISI